MVLFQIEIFDSTVIIFCHTTEVITFLHSNLDEHIDKIIMI